jgi:hypothetical protein
MNNMIYSKEDRYKIIYELSLFSNGFVGFFIGQLILTIFKLCSLNLWFYSVMALLLIYWSVTVFRKLETSNKVLFCVLHGIFLILIFVSYKFSPICI